MKKKIVKVGSHKEISKRLLGHGTFRITGADKITGERMILWFKGKREQAEEIEIDSSKYDNNQVIDLED